MSGEDAGPEVEGVDILPVVDRFVRIVGIVFNAVTKVDRELADECETGCVGDV